jgi:hypothetical protein
MRTRFLNLTLCAVVLIVGGCVSNKTIPAIEIKPEIPRDAYEVLNTVEGISTTSSILLGLIQVVDGEYLKLFGIPFYKEQYSFSCGYLGLTAARAYYKALSVTPEADAVFYKSMDSEHSGFPLLSSSETVTFRGKAIKLKTDQELYGPGGARAATRARSMRPYKLKVNEDGSPFKDANGNFIFVPVD